MRKLLSVGLLVTLPINLAWAVGSGGYTNQVVGTKALGMGNAFVATADDPSAIYFNPAGLTQLDRPNLSLGFAIHDTNSDYTPVGGSKVSMEGFTPVVPNFYFTTPFREKWAFGFGINSPFGLETKWSGTGPLRYVATDSNLQLVNFNPTVAYKLNEKISFGAGVVYGLVDADLKSKVNVTAINGSSSPDGDRKLEGDGSAWGYDFGLLYAPVEKHKFGLTYRSQLSTTLDGSLELNGLSGIAASAFVFNGTSYKTDAETVIKFPQTVLLGYAYKPSKWTFAIDGEWVDYSAVDDTTIDYKDQSAGPQSVLRLTNPTDRDWHNTWNLGLGTNYQFNDTWQARGGYFYYPRAIPERTWDPGNPESSRNGFTLGGSFTRPSIIFDLAYNLILFDDRTISNTVGSTSGTTVNGKYETTAHIVSANLTYRFGTAN
ncbi:MAG: putative outer membrane protein [Elusimicrobia bacterium]|nr:putative outer membrane protein [Elusimicrobiota bacterium]